MAMPTKRELVSSNFVLRCETGYSPYWLRFDGPITETPEMGAS